MRITRIATAAGGLAIASALVLSGCSTGGGETPAGDPTAVITANGSEPQNPLIPTNTNETNGGRIWAKPQY